MNWLSSFIPSMLHYITVSHTFFIIFLFPWFVFSFNISRCIYLCCFLFQYLYISTVSGEGVSYSLWTFLFVGENIFVCRWRTYSFHYLYYFIHCSILLWYLQCKSVLYSPILWLLGAYSSMSTTRRREDRFIYWCYLMYWAILVYRVGSISYFIFLCLYLDQG